MAVIDSIIIQFDSDDDLEFTVYDSEGYSATEWISKAEFKRWLGIP